MLLEFKVNNYKSFAEEAVFCMTAAPKQKGLDYSLFKKKLDKKNIKVLCSSVIYGPNAAGKSNIIGAMDVFRSIVLRGNINNISNISDNEMINPAAGMLELIPNKDSSERKPVEFSVFFYTNGMFIRYCLSLDLGFFMESDYKRKVLNEVLLVDEKTVFERNGEKIRVDGVKQLMDENVFESLEKIAHQGLTSTDLFLANGFRHIFAPQIAQTVIGWFSNKLMAICRANYVKSILINPKGNFYIEETINKAAKIFGINSNAIGYKQDEESAFPQLYSALGKTEIPAEIFESYGTVRFINNFPLIMRALKDGQTLIVDELDASIHPSAIMNIVNIFHNDEINKNHAQLIFNTHNPVFLNRNLFRRDEIKFVERDDVNHQSTLYSLSDFKTSGKSGVRKSEDYMENYFVSRYGAIKDIDFTPVFERLMSDSNEV